MISLRTALRASARVPTRDIALAGMEKATVAVIGAGPTGLTMLKNLREDGFAVTLFERRSQVGGLWAYSGNTSWTTALPRTLANISKFTCAFSDYPMPDRYPTYMKPRNFQEYMEDYAKHFDLMKDIVFNTTVCKVVRNEDDTKWKLEIERSGKLEMVEFDKVALCHGYQTEAVMPQFEGQEKFEGPIIHSQNYRSPDSFKGKNVVVLGLSSTSADVIPDLIPHAAKVYVSHRRGTVPFRRYRNGTPQDLQITWRRRQIGAFMQRHFPRLSRTIADAGIRYLAHKNFPNLDPAWRIEPFPSVTLSLPGSIEFLIPLLEDGKLTSLHGLRRFRGPHSVEFADGTILDDVDAVVMCTGYCANWRTAPFVETSRPRDPAYGGADMYRLWMNLFPPRYADSAVLLCYSAFGKNNGFSFSDVTAMAVSNVWRGVEPLPRRPDMERWIDAHQAWVATRYRLDPTVDASMVKQWEFQGWLHQAAGTGMENLGWGWKGWAFWWRDRTMYNLMNNGLETAHAFRFFETGKRRTWDGAREAIVHANETVKIFPVKKGEEF